MKEGKQMKVHSSSRSLWKNCPQFVPYELLNEERAKRNHDQTLDRLNERGGMGCMEILDNINDRRLTNRNETQQDADELAKILAYIITPVEPVIKLNTTIDHSIGSTTKAIVGTAPVVEKEEKPSEIPLYTVENLRKLVLQIPPEKRDEWVKEHSAAAAKILYSLFHSMALNTHIDATFAFPEGDHFRLRFEKLFTQETKAEDQEELWKEVLLINESGSDEYAIKEFVKRFKITRL